MGTRMCIFINQTILIVEGLLASFYNHPHFQSVTPPFYLLKYSQQMQKLRLRKLNQTWNQTRVYIFFNPTIIPDTKTLKSAYEDPLKDAYSVVEPNFTLGVIFGFVTTTRGLVWFAPSLSRGLQRRPRTVWFGQTWYVQWIGSDSEGCFLLLRLQSQTS